MLGGAGEGAVFRYRVEYLKSAICHGLDKYDLFPGIKAQSAPFGGMKQSGLGREGGREGIYEFCETQFIAVEW